MYEQMNIIVIEPTQLIDMAHEMKLAGNRLVQICCTNVKIDEKPALEVSYTFDKDHVQTNWRLLIEEGVSIGSISNIFPPAFLYENEMHDLFGLEVRNMTVDFQGNLYKLSSKTPWSNRPVEETVQAEEIKVTLSETSEPAKEAQVAAEGESFAEKAEAEAPADKAPVEEAQSEESGKDVE